VPRPARGQRWNAQKPSAGEALLPQGTELPVPIGTPLSHCNLTCTNAESIFGQHPTPFDAIVTNYFDSKIFRKFTVT
jgi:hypothetical protein